MNHILYGNARDVDKKKRVKKEEEEEVQRQSNREMISIPVIYELCWICWSNTFHSLAYLSLARSFVWLFVYLRKCICESILPASLKIERGGAEKKFCRMTLKASYWSAFKEHIKKNTCVVMLLTASLSDWARGWWKSKFRKVIIFYFSNASSHMSGCQKEFPLKSSISVSSGELVLTFADSLKFIIKISPKKLNLKFKSKPTNLKLSSLSIASLNLCK